MNNKIIMGFIWIFLLVNISLALKPAPASFYGYVTTKEGYAPIGTVIEVYDSSMTLCGSFVVKQEGRYGLLLCEGDDPATETDEGAVSGENLVFYINSFKAKTKEIPVWQSSVLKELNLFLGEEIEPIQESPSKVPYTTAKETIIKIISLVGSIVLIIIFLWLYNKK